MEIIESIIWVAIGFGPTLLTLQLLASGKEGIAVGRRLGKLEESKPEMEVTI